MVTTTWKCVFDKPKPIDGNPFAPRLRCGITASHGKNSSRTMMHVVSSGSEKEARQKIRMMYGKNVIFVSVERIDSIKNERENKNG